MTRIVLPGLFGPGADLEKLDWKPFHEGVEIYRIYGDGVTGPSAALLRYRPGAIVPRHRHEGLEHITILQGDQSDDHDTVHAGTLIVNTPGTTHQIISRNGCIALVLWEKPVTFTGNVAPALAHLD
jgi:anti-sigma factor ChrR (cupin superfamily)